jgi:choline monooxygenase
VERNEGFVFEPDLAAARTIPSSWYLDAAVLEREEARVFARTWQLVGGAAQAGAPGDYFTCQVGREPLVIAADEAGKRRALSNVCRHRAGPVARGSGNRRSLQCGYHGWTYGLDGRLLAAPEFEGVRGFDRAAIALPEARLESWEGFLFVNLDPDAPPLREFLGAIPDETRGLEIERLTLRRRVDYEVACNWKVYVDNYLEGYHIPIVHPSLFRELDYPKYWTETKQHYSIQHAPLKRADRIRATSSDDDVSYYWIYPNLMLNVYPDNFSTNLIVPLGHERTLTAFEWYFRDPDEPAVKKAIEETVAFSDEIQLEDIDICEAVQRGLRSKTYESGRYSPSRENGLHHFHALYARAMGLTT